MADKFIIKHYKITPYKIKLKQALQTASSCLSFRQGFIIKISTRNAYTAWGECAPMSAIGTESLLQAEQFLQQKLTAITGREFTEDLLQDTQDFPACRFALESILLSLKAQQSNKALFQILNPELKKAKLKVNAMLGALDKNTVVQAKQAEVQGFHCLKIKLGLKSLTVELTQLKSLLKQLSANTLIRLDANKSWTIEESEWLLQQLKPYKKQIDSIEEPLKIFDNKAYHYLQSKTTIALALDESFSSSESLEHFPVQRLILKPAAQGGLVNTLQRVQQAQQRGIECIITSSIESGYGLWAISHCCAAVNNQQYHGIATASWLQDTLITPPEINNGCITF